MVDDDRWWVLPGDVLRQLLTRAAAGESVDLLLAELWANSDTEDAP